MKKINDCTKEELIGIINDIGIHAMFYISHLNIKYREKEEANKEELAYTLSYSVHAMIDIIKPMHDYLDDLYPLNSSLHEQLINIHKKGKETMPTISTEEAIKKGVIRGKMIDEN